MKKIIGIDFDGTCVTDLYPYVGDNIGAASVLRKLAELIDSLRRLAKKWEKDGERLWLYSASGSLHVTYMLSWERIFNM